MRVLISGGGTGGHVFPAIAVAQALSRNDPDGTVLYVGRRGGMEERIIPGYQIPLETIVAAKLDMEQLWRNWSFPFVLPRAFLMAGRIVRRFRPEVVLGTGGYVSAPVIMAAATLRIPVVLQEQNYLPGRTTRLLARVATVVATAAANRWFRPLTQSVSVRGIAEASFIGYYHLQIVAGGNSVLANGLQAITVTGGK